MIPINELAPHQQEALTSHERGDAEIIAILGIAQNIVEQRQSSLQPEITDVNIDSYQPIITPLEVGRRYPQSEKSKKTVLKSRHEIERTLHNPSLNSKLIVVAGPCSIHDPEAALEYASQVAKWRELHGDYLEIVMRAYLEKPRTTIGWEGFIEDPDLDGSYNKNKGLLESRRLVMDVTDSGVPVATELVNTDTPQYLDDGISLGAIGARTIESQLHRKLASGVSFPWGAKNGTGGSVDIAIDAIISASHPHYMDGTDMLGRRSRYKTKGNPYGFLILRGSKQGPNFDEDSIIEAGNELVAADLTDAKMIDCSHKNKVNGQQSTALKSVAKQVANGDQSIIGVMIESNLVAGSQKVVKGEPLVYGQSITDTCESIEDTEQHLVILAEAVKSRMALSQ